mmetsp:Transcript_40019/g.85412  ORF Transcript_40019/g.85412 Transcript_40019/m.85412 type:complete len:229 (-) Transcript_40019:205-891(-)
MAEPAGGPPCAAAVAEVFTDRRVARLVANASGGAAGLHPSEQIGFALLQHHELLVNTLQLCERRALMRGNRLMQHERLARHRHEPVVGSSRCRSATHHGRCGPPVTKLLGSGDEVRRRVPKLARLAGTLVAQRLLADGHLAIDDKVVGLRVCIPAIVTRTALTQILLAHIHLRVNRSRCDKRYTSCWLREGMTCGDVAALTGGHRSLCHFHQMRRWVPEAAVLSRAVV